MDFTLRILLFSCIIGVAASVRCYHCGYYKEMPDHLKRYWVTRPISKDCLKPKSSMLKSCPGGYRCGEGAVTYKGLKFYERLCVPSMACMSKARMQGLVKTLDKDLKVESFHCCTGSRCNRTPSTKLISKQ
ncbi:uncharacterized protein LOC141908929 [Tubulanus polymorphus]|uniref:uncharacterized protein LOC141908929 n=1 Tax=Tubulanus polymorphus TaxID=672921 RepID=UPI003DA22D55